MLLLICNQPSSCDNHSNTSFGNGSLPSNHFKIIHFFFDHRIFATFPDIDLTLFNITVHGYFAITFAASSSIVSTAENSKFQLGFLINDSKILTSKVFKD
jgi:hypothetical protein